mgnify:CR=1 FL=1
MHGSFGDVISSIHTPTRGQVPIIHIGIFRTLINVVFPKAKAYIKIKQNE